ncbi:uncharacterized protein VTP21DRAFT_8221 [Calcarisporiella thermophila]|uniref:uncharacterized protein n=1 Tax=Calcarisporiella thermophila TaxID=911321 RepID=UPI0037428623
MTTQFNELPIIDLAPLYESNTSKEEVYRLALALREVFETVGFAYLINHGVSVSHRQLFDKARNFFSLPGPAKRKLAKRLFEPANPNTYRGFFPSQKDDSSYKEGFEVGPPKSPVAKSNRMALGKVEKFDLLEDNVWPPESDLPNFRREVELYYHECIALGENIMRLVAISLGLPEDYFRPFFEGNVSTLRFLHYPKRRLENGTVTSDKAMFSCTPHTDSGIITLLVQDETGGLEVLNSLGQWIPAPYVPESFVVNLGDLMSRWINGRFVATMHRVQMVQGDRISIPFFFEPNIDAVIEPLHILVGDDHPKYERVIYGDFVRSKMVTWAEYREDIEEDVVE